MAAGAPIPGLGHVFVDAVLHARSLHDLDGPSPSATHRSGS
jgi:hypothetical protein